jgi:hypothetical protein
VVDSLELSTIGCPRCDNAGWVCEAHTKAKRAINFAAQHLFAGSLAFIRFDSAGTL